MDERWYSVVFFGGFAGAATFAGMYLVLMRKKLSSAASANLVSYAAGVLLGVGILHVLPEAQELTEHAPIFVLLSFVLFYFLEHHILIHAGHEELHHTRIDVAAGHDECCRHPHPLGIIAFVGMGMHSLIDGLIIGTGFEVSSEVGLLSAIAVIAHEVPEGIAMISILLHYGYQRRKGIIYTSLVAIATPLAAIATFALVREIDPSSLGILLALAAGSFIYIGASDLIPESHRARGITGSLSLCGGILTAFLAGMLTHGTH
jgi:ZIP family zinc transporter/zinc and cadmium transporter